MKKKPLILGLDTSLSCTGWALLTLEANPKLVVYGKIQSVHDEKIDEDLDLLERYKLINAKVDELFSRYEIAGVAIEQPNSSRNMKVTRKLIGIYQIVRFFIFLRHLKVTKELNTMTVKKIVIGNGGAKKPEVVQFINKLYNKKFQFHKTNKDKTDDDICDAICVALAYIKQEDK